MKKFKEELNTAVITTRFILEKESPILCIFHYDDGFWQFSGSEKNLSDSDYRVISLEEMINIDKSIVELADLPYNSVAYRKDIHSSWEIQIN
jgi:hypothetical protein